jgi:serine/threonine protein kinase
MRIVVGQGAFGEVFQARKRGTLEIYAMKVMRKDKILEKNHAEYMKSEKEILTKVDHPFIVQLRYSFQVREHSFCAHSQSSYRWGGKYIAILDSLQPHCRPHMLGTGAKFSRRLSRRN